MRNRTLRSVIGVMMSVLLPASMLMADGSGAVLRASGPTFLNGAAISRNAAVFKGDTVSTTTGSAALTTSGNSVLVPENSSVKYEGSSISLGSGQAVVTTATGMKARVDTITVTPNSSNARYEVVKQDGKVTIAALTGALTIADATHTAVLEEGTMGTVDPQDTTPSPGVRTDKDSWVKSKKKAALIFLLAGGAAAGIAIALSGQPSSPVHP